MIDFKDLKMILKEIEEKELFNDFLMNLFGYKKENLNNIIIRYFFDEGFIIDIFEHNKENKFYRYIFNKNKSDIIINENLIIYNINVKKTYKENNNRLYLFASLFHEKNKTIIINNLNKLFDKNIVNLFLRRIN